MIPRAPTNLPASIHQRLLNQAKAEGRSLQELLQYFAIERFLFRLGQSRHASRFLLKGALMLRLWETATARPTLDIDLMGRMEVTEESVAQAIRDIIAVKVPDDGMRFEGGSLRTDVIRLDADYQGVRARFVANIGNMRIPMQVDVGSGDVVVPGAVKIEFPVLLDFPAPSLLAYPPETAIAEKYQAIVSLDMANSRMKDFYDVWTLAGHRTFDGRSLAEAIGATFERRQTPVPREVPMGLSDRFAETEAKQAQWRAFLRKSRIKMEGQGLEAVMRLIRDFLMPPSRAASVQALFASHWPPGGPWQRRLTRGRVSDK